MQLTEDEARGLEDRQAAMAGRLGRRGVSDVERGTIVVLPSITFPPEELRKIIGIQYYEERMLCMTFLLRRPRLEIVFVTSHEIDPAVIDYYLSFLPDPESARRRLHLISVDDVAPRSLSDKILEHPEMLDRIRERVRYPEESYVFPFNVTDREALISEALGLPLYGPLPSQTAFGSKSGSRRVARVAGVPVLEGAEDLYSLEEVEGAINRILEAKPACRSVVIKLNNGFSGQGNVIIDVDDLESPLDASSAVFCASEETWGSFTEKLRKEGGVVEEHARASGLVSPSVQMRIFGDGDYEVVSTHDQILGGPDDQVYLGCRFPADGAYRTRIQAYGLGIARELASHGVIGSFGIDFIVIPDGPIYLAEINLRLGGTTHPFLTARFLTQGVYDIPTGHLLAGEGRRTYVATDNIKSDDYIGLEPGVVIKAVNDAGLAYDPESSSGVALHLLGALADHGKVGTTCIAPDLEGAEAMRARVIEILDGLSSR